MNYNYQKWSLWKQCTGIHEYVCVCMHACARVFVNAFMHVRVNGCIWVFVIVCMYV